MESGKELGIVKVGEKGQIVIPKSVRKLFDISSGDTLLVMADKEKGIALVKPDGYFEFAKELLKAKNNVEDEEE